MMLPPTISLSMSIEATYHNQNVSQDLHKARYYTSTTQERKTRREQWKRRLERTTTQTKRTMAQTRRTEVEKPYENKDWMSIKKTWTSTTKMRRKEDKTTNDEQGECTWKCVVGQEWRSLISVRVFGMNGGWKYLERRITCSYNVKLTNCNDMWGCWWLDK